MKKILTLLIAFTIVFTSLTAFNAWGADVETEDAIVDIVVLRPVGLFVLAGGSVVYAASWPLAYITNSVDTTKRVFVREPYEYTFSRQIGKNG